MPVTARLVLLTLFLSAASSAGAREAGSSGAFTLQQIMSAPFNSGLTAAPAKDRFAWVSNAEGRRNIWIAMPSQNRGGYLARQITNYADDDGQEISDLEWSPDANFIVYVRGGSSDNPEKIAPNPAHLPGGAQQAVWAVPITGGEPREIGEGDAPSVSPAGDWIAWFTKGQIWYVRASAAFAPAGSQTLEKQARFVQVFGDCSSFTWSPDGAELAFVSDRDSHSFIGVLSFATRTLHYIDPGTDHDRYPVWSPDGKAIAFVRVPYFKEEQFDGPERSGQPWSIRVADVATGTGRQVWQAAEGTGSVFRALATPQQILWSATDTLIFPWEKDGWLHLYAVSADGGPARLLTPGKFEVEWASASPNHGFVVFSSNEGDSERRHIWQTSATDESPKALSHGDGIEVAPVVGSDNRTVAVLRSDARIPLRPALLLGPDQIRDLAPRSIPVTFPAKQLIVPQPVVYSSPDGMRIHADLFLPPASGQCVRHPAIVFVHGGSQRQMLLGWHYMYYYSNAYAMNQYLTSRGYIVLVINYRSGIGYGLDFREAAGYGPTGGSEFQDVQGAGVYLRSRCDVDPAAIGIWGGSWGGYLTAMALARASDMFAAGVDMSGVHDWNIDNPINFSISDTAADPNARWRLAWQSSPLSSVKDWRSPVLLIQGDADPEVPFLQTVELAAALRQQKVDFEELIFPDEAHDFLLHRTWYAAYAASAEFFERHLKATGK